MHATANASPAQALEILKSARTVAVLGAHSDPARPAHYVPAYLAQQGLRVLPVNPALVGQVLWGEPVRAALTDLQTPVDVVVVFRRSEVLAGHVQEIAAMAPQPRVVWFQLGIRHQQVAEQLAVTGLVVVQDRCTLADHRSWAVAPVPPATTAKQGRIVVLASGSGSNFAAILSACASGEIPGRVVKLIVDRSGAYARVRAQQAGVADCAFPFGLVRDAGGSRDDYDARLATVVAAAKPDVVVLAGFMRVLSPAFLDGFGDRVLNLHPALPGQFAGTHAIERAHDAFAAGTIAYTGCMVHRVIPEVDAGPVLDTERVEIVAGEPLAELETRMHAAEHRLLVRALAGELRRLGFGAAAT
jgi:formyltetrahydrofolate-dependent phosphoribosylglycinamide formyltransferase